MVATACSPVAGWTFRGAALALAALLLGVQCYTIFSSTDETAFNARLYAVSAILAIAFLPIALEYARRARSKWLVTSVALAGTALFLYSLPGTLTRAGELRERDALAGVTYANAQRTYDQASDALDNCKRDRRRDCTLAERDVERKRTDLRASKTGNIVGDVGARIITHWLPVSEATVRAVSAVAYAIGAELAIAALMAVVVRGAPGPQLPDQPQPTPTPAPVAQPRKKRRKPAIETWIRGYLAQHEETSLADAYASYMEAKTGGRKVTEDRFGKTFQAAAKREGRTLKREGKRTLYVVAA